MFDLIELDRAETLLRALAGGEPLAPPAPEPAPRPQGDISRCPHFNAALRREDIAA